MNNNINILVKNFDLKKWFESIVSKLQKIENFKDEDLSIVILDNEQIRKLNKKYRNIDEPTDVLSFAQCDIKKEYLLEHDSYLGEIFINIEQFKKQPNNIKNEIINLLIHGYLHLRGYTHNNERERKEMDKLSRELIIRMQSM